LTEELAGWIEPNGDGATEVSLGGPNFKLNRKESQLPSAFLRVPPRPGGAAPQTNISSVILNPLASQRAKNLIKPEKQVRQAVDKEDGQEGEEEAEERKRVVGKEKTAGGQAQGADQDRGSFVAFGVKMDEPDSEDPVGESKEEKVGEETQVKKGEGVREGEGKEGVTQGKKVEPSGFL